MKGIMISAFLLLLSCTKAEKKSVKSEPVKEDVQLLDVNKTVDSANFDILNFLVKEEAGTMKNADVDLKNYSVQFSDEGDPYTVNFSKIAEGDFNSDGKVDYIVNCDSEGMLGGNANTNSEIIYIIMNADNTIAEKHKILKYAPFSYNILEGISYDKGVLKVEATQNYRTYMSDSLQSTNLSFVYQDGNVYEKSYLTNCKLAEWKNKSIFKNPSKALRTIEPHNYTQLIEETFIGKGFEISAEISGCDNLNTVFEANFKTADTSKKNTEAKRNFFLDFLVNNTNLKTMFSSVQNFYLHNDPPHIFIQEGDLSFKIFTTAEKGNINFRLVLDQETNLKQTENWGIMTREK